MVAVLAVDAFGFLDLVVGFLLDVGIQFLLVYHPAVVLAVVAVAFAFFDVGCGGQPAE